MSLKIAVYSPAKNEEHNVADWCESAWGADEIILVDTGSNDGTQQAADVAGVLVAEVTISPWRFDVGHNVALSHVSPDIDIAIPLALDERLWPGWRGELEEAWGRGGRQFTYRYLWGNGLEYRHDRIHARHGYVWKYPAHECVIGSGPKVDTNIVIEQPGGESNPRRGDDGPLIHLMLTENPGDTRAMYYSARQYYYENKWTESRALFSEYLASKTTHAQERSEACRIMSRMVWPDRREAWLLRAASECPQRREVWADLIVYYRETGQEGAARGAAARAGAITEQTPHNSFHLETWAWDDKALGINTSA